MAINIITTHTITLSDLELKKLKLELAYFIETHAQENPKPYKWDEDPIADANVRASEDFLISFLRSLNGST